MFCRFLTCLISPAFKAYTKPANVSSLNKFQDTHQTIERLGLNDQRPIEIDRNGRRLTRIFHFQSVENRCDLVDVTFVFETPSI